VGQGSSFDDGIIGSGWEGQNGAPYLGKKTLSGFVGGFRKKAKAKDDKDKEREYKGGEREHRDIGKERDKEEKKERERLRKDIRKDINKDSSKEPIKEGGSELRFVALADGHSFDHGYHHGDEYFYNHKRK